MTHKCPVCGYAELEYGATLGEICPSCGTMFGVSDDAVEGKDHATLRHEWLMHGAPWRDRVIPMPRGWKVIGQLRNIGYQPTRDEITALMRTSHLTVK